jgi:hypothetical protein
MTAHCPSLTFASTPNMYGPKLTLFALALLAATVSANPLERRCGTQGAACSTRADCCANYLCDMGMLPRTPALRSVVVYVCGQGASTFGRDGWLRARRGMLDAEVDQISEREMNRVRGLQCSHAQPSWYRPRSSAARTAPVPGDDELSAV